MLRYIIILLSDDAVSFCHYATKKECGNVMSPGILKKAIFWAMKENLSVHFVHSRNNIDDELSSLMNSIAHVNIVPSECANTKLLSEAEIVVHDGWEQLKSRSGQSQVIRTSLCNLLNNTNSLKALLKNSDRINIVITDVENFNDGLIKDYQEFVESLIPTIVAEYKNDHQVQLNLLTDRLMLKQMNNCNAGYESITLAPDGKFYICPAFYLDNKQSVGDIENGLDIKNPQLYRLTHAPICRICDAFQCKRCIWLNKTMCREVNTPSHQQCVLAHIERSASKRLLEEFRRIDSSFLKEIDIPEVDYFDPFNVVTK